jgi:DNA-binding LytR/AlgR family response regulator
VVFVTGHDEHAVRAFETSAVDYVLKPVSRERLGRPLDKLERQRSDSGHARLGALLGRLVYRVSRRPPQYSTRVMVEDEPRTTLIEAAAVSRFVANGKGTVVIAAEGSISWGTCWGSWRAAWIRGSSSESTSGLS